MGLYFSITYLATNSFLFQNIEPIKVVTLSFQTNYFNRLNQLFKAPKHFVRSL